MAKLAGRQHGMVARQQLLTAGVSGAAIGRLTASGWLTAVHAGVYAAAGGPMTTYARWMAAVLAGGPAALLSHVSAGGLWRIIDLLPGPPHVTVPGGKRRRRGIVFHRARDLTGARATRDRIPVTTPSRTLLDLAATLTPRRLERAVETADRLELLDIAELTHLAETSRGRKGSARLSSVLAHFRPAPATRSELERRFLRLCHQAGLPRPAVNVPVAGFEVDFAWPDARLVVEIDGYEFHRDRAAFERDRRRDAQLQLAGYRVLRITYRRLVDEPASVLADLVAVLGSPN